MLLGFLNLGGVEILILIGIALLIIGLITVIKWIVKKK